MYKFILGFKIETLFIILHFILILIVLNILHKNIIAHFPLERTRTNTHTHTYT